MLEKINGKKVVAVRHGRFIEKDCKEIINVTVDVSCIDASVLGVKGQDESIAVGYVLYKEDKTEYYLLEDFNDTYADLRHNLNFREETVLPVFAILQILDMDLKEFNNDKWTFVFTDELFINVEDEKFIIDDDNSIILEGNVDDLTLKMDERSVFEMAVDIKILKQLNEIRKEGKYNMFSINRVLEEANDKGFYALVDYISEVHGSRVRVDKKAYMQALNEMGNLLENGDLDD